MKTTILSSIIFATLFSSTLHAGLSSSMPSTFLATGIPNSHQLSPNVIRGMAPRNASDLQKLLDLGVENFLMFKVDTNGDIAKEINNLLALGVPKKNILHLDFPWKDISNYGAICEMTVDALNMIKASESKNQGIYFHCTVGEDRTGYLAGLYRISRGDTETRQEIFEGEMCDKGYEAGNPKKGLVVVKQVRAGLTPAFLAMADLIEKNEGKKLTKAMCKGLVVPTKVPKEFNCKKSRLLL